MTAEELKKQICKMLENCGNADQESGWIVSRATAVPVMEILFSRRPLEESEIARALAMAERRRNGEPLQYILGDEYFGEILLKVGKGCLIPRPETWGIVEFLTPRIPPEGTCCELGVGSGAVSIAIARERSDVSVFGSELSDDALYWAKRNLAAYDLPNVEFRRGSLFEPFPGMKFDTVAANLPYIPFREKENLQREVRDFEPEIALFAENDGMALIQEALLGLRDHLAPGGCAIFEMGEEQTVPLAAYAGRLPFLKNPEIRKDCFGVVRFLTVEFQG